jgi:hypothetical protein
MSVCRCTREEECSGYNRGYDTAVLPDDGTVICRKGQRDCGQWRGKWLKAGSRGRGLRGAETTKPSYFYEGFVLYGAAPDER